MTTLKGWGQILEKQVIDIYVVKEKTNMEMKIIKWTGYEIRFVEYDGEWWAVLKDIADALHMRSNDIANRVDPDMLERVSIEVSNTGSNGNRSRGDNKTRSMLVINEYGIYEALFASRKLEARKFRLWSSKLMRKLRQNVGLEGYEVLRMTEKEIQEDIDFIIDTLFYDEETGHVMRSVTMPGGDVDQVIYL